MLRIEKGHERRLRTVVPLTRSFLTARILRRRDDFEILTLQFFVNFLPAWQIEAAASPGGPGEDQRFLAAKIGEVHHFARPVRHREIGRYARIVEAAAHHWNFAEAPHALFDDERLAEFAREAGQVEPRTALERLRHRNAHVGPAGALRLQLEFVDARKIGRSDPQVFSIRPNRIQLHGRVIVENSRAGSARSRERRGSPGGRNQKVSAIQFHLASLPSSLG